MDAYLIGERPTLSLSLLSSVLYLYLFYEFLSLLLFSFLNTSISPISWSMNSKHFPILFCLSLIVEANINYLSADCLHLSHECSPSLRLELVFSFENEWIFTFRGVFLLLSLKYWNFFSSFILFILLVYSNTLTT